MEITIRYSGEQGGSKTEAGSRRSLAGYRPNPLQSLTLALCQRFWLPQAGIAVLWPQYLALTVMVAGALWLAIVRLRKITAL